MAARKATWTRTESAKKAAAARSAGMTAERRSEIARVAAIAKADKAKGTPRETHSGELGLAGGIPCAVLSNGMRVLSANGLARAFGSGHKGLAETEDGRLPPIMAAANLRPYISAELINQLKSPIEYRARSGGRLAMGYEAEMLHKMCEVLLDARAAGVLRAPQLPAAAAAERLMRGFAKVGLIALIDEATGYQAERARDELHRILEAYISKELLPWTKKFPDDFFEQIYRIHGWKYEMGNTQRPGYVGHFINRCVYEQLPDGVVEELRRKNPPVNGTRKHKHFQFLTEHTGNPHLDKQIVAVTTTLKLSTDKEDFKSKFKRLFPARGDQTELFDDPMNEVLDMGIGWLTQNLSGTPRERALSALASGRPLLTRVLAKLMYDQDDLVTVGKARQLLSTMAKEGLVSSPEKGKWQRLPA